MTGFGSLIDTGPWGGIAAVIVLQVFAGGTDLPVVLVIAGEIGPREAAVFASGFFEDRNVRLDAPLMDEPGEGFSLGQATPFAPRTIKDEIEEALFERGRDLFTDLSVVFMDTTSLSFTGAGGETLGQRGHSKGHRPDLNQMILAVVIDGDGRPVCSEMAPGNTADVTVLLPIVDRLRHRFGSGGAVELWTTLPSPAGLIMRTTSVRGSMPALLTSGFRPLASGPKSTERTLFDAPRPL
jgi:hypothetical protein